MLKPSKGKSRNGHWNNWCCIQYIGVAFNTLVLHWCCIQYIQIHSIHWCCIQYIGPIVVAFNRWNSNCGSSTSNPSIPISPSPPLLILIICFYSWLHSKFVWYFFQSFCLLKRPLYSSGDYVALSVRPNLFKAMKTGLTMSVLCANIGLLSVLGEHISKGSVRLD